MFGGKFKPEGVASTCLIGTEHIAAMVIKLITRHGFIFILLTFSVRPAIARRSIEDLVYWLKRHVSKPDILCFHENARAKELDYGKELAHADRLIFGARAGWLRDAEN
jgi:hypothetical protein